MEKICWQITIATLMHAFQYDLRSSAAKTIVLRMQPQHAATLTQPLQCDQTELQNAIELHATASETAAPKPDLDAKAKKRRFWSTFKKDF